eukprot:TRINITY_DN1083_c1_g1_i11.p2 TRINITY_DN1083_c1_g1~~TRINITY_DN1083_c1_g1_i11.p2  ORF type:complete len:140 (-),score=0.93 TRINITY_DN1083_c1_g1_i11:226-645(-)
MQTYYQKYLYGKLAICNLDSILDVSKNTQFFTRQFFLHYSVCLKIMVVMELLKKPVNLGKGYWLPFWYDMKSFHVSVYNVIFQIFKWQCCILFILMLKQKYCTDWQGNIHSCDKYIYEQQEAVPKLLGNFMLLFVVRCA